ncbi:hypothetical protein C7E18_23735, partial [Stenotrophomonas maltophilia]
GLSVAEVTAAIKAQNAQVASRPARRAPSVKGQRIWLDPNKLHTYGLSVAEVTAAIKAQNAQVASRPARRAPSVKGQ